MRKFKMDENQIKSEKNNKVKLNAKFSYFIREML